MNSRKIILGLALAGAAALVLWQLTRRHAPAITRSSPSARPANVTQPSSPTEAGQSAKPAAPTTVAAAPAAAAELQATARMYAAHAPLRTPEVADPDSHANKQILGTMVAKALAQPASPPAAGHR